MKTPSVNQAMPSYRVPLKSAAQLKFEADVRRFKAEWLVKNPKPSRSTKLMIPRVAEVQAHANQFRGPADVKAAACGLVAPVAAGRRVLTQLPLFLANAL